jgi:multiple sugar transport system substrate-binding protein
MVLYYNKDIFDARGVAYPDGTWDWNTFREAAKKLTVRDGDKVSSWGYAAGDWWPWTMTWLYQNGGGVLDASGKPVANSPENVAALEFYNSMVFTDKSTPSPIDYANAGLKNGQPDPLFAQGKLAMETTGFWNISSLKDSKLKWDIAPLWHGKKSAVPAFGSGLAVSNQSKHKDAAAKLVQYLTSAEGQMPIVTSGLDVPANLEAVGSEAFKKPVWNTSGVNLAAFTDSAPVIYSPPLLPEWNEIQKAFTDGMDAAWKGEEPVKTGLDKVQESLESIFR